MAQSKEADGLSSVLLYIIIFHFVPRAFKIFRSRVMFRVSYIALFSLTLLSSSTFQCKLLRSVISSFDRSIVMDL